jgi:hypothetical protein
VKPKAGATPPVPPKAKAKAKVQAPRMKLSKLCLAAPVQHNSQQNVNTDKRLFTKWDQLWVDDKGEPSTLSWLIKVWPQAATSDLACIRTRLSMMDFDELFRIPWEPLVNPDEMWKRSSLLNPMPLGWGIDDAIKYFHGGNGYAAPSIRQYTLQPSPGGAGRPDQPGLYNCTHRDRPFNFYATVFELPFRHPDKTMMWKKFKMVFGQASKMPWPHHYKVGKYNARYNQYVLFPGMYQTMWVEIAHVGEVPFVIPEVIEDDCTGRERSRYRNRVSKTESMITPHAGAAKYFVAGDPPPKRRRKGPDTGAWDQLDDLDLPNETRQAIEKEKKEWEDSVAAKKIARKADKQEAAKRKRLEAECERLTKKLKSKCAKESAPIPVSDEEKDVLTSTEPALTPTEPLPTLEELCECLCYPYQDRNDHHCLRLKMPGMKYCDFCTYWKCRCKCKACDPPNRNQASSSSTQPVTYRPYDAPMPNTQPGPLTPTEPFPPVHTPSAAHDECPSYHDGHYSSMTDDGEDTGQRQRAPSVSPVPEPAPEPAAFSSPSTAGDNTEREEEEEAFAPEWW